MPSLLYEDLAQEEVRKSLRMRENMTTETSTQNENDD
jgi:hypothetical protein